MCQHERGNLSGLVLTPSLSLSLSLSTAKNSTQSVSDAVIFKLTQFVLLLL